MCYNIVRYKKGANPMDILSQSEIDNLIKKLLQDTSVLPDNAGSVKSGAVAEASKQASSVSYAF